MEHALHPIRKRCVAPITSVSLLHLVHILAYWSLLYGVPSWVNLPLTLLPQETCIELSVRRLLGQYQLVLSV